MLSASVHTYMPRACEAVLRRRWTGSSTNAQLDRESSVVTWPMHVHLRSILCVRRPCAAIPPPPAGSTMKQMLRNVSILRNYVNSSAS